MKCSLSSSQSDTRKKELMSHWVIHSKMGTMQCVFHWLSPTVIRFSQGIVKREGKIHRDYAIYNKFTICLVFIWKIKLFCASCQVGSCAISGKYVGKLVLGLNWAKFRLGWNENLNEESATNLIHMKIAFILVSLVICSASRHFVSEKSRWNASTWWCQLSQSNAMEDYEAINGTYHLIITHLIVLTA